MTRSTKPGNSVNPGTSSQAKTRGPARAGAGRWAYLAALGLGVVVVLLGLRGGPGGGSGAPLAEVVVPPLSVAEQDGESLFNERCASCHGDNATGRDGIAPPLVHRLYEPGHHGDEAFTVAARFGVRSHHWSFGDMPPVDGVTEQEIAAIVTYVRALQRANGID